jgi:hypothetical protein
MLECVLYDLQPPGNASPICEVNRRPPLKGRIYLPHVRSHLDDGGLVERPARRQAYLPPRWTRLDHRGVEVVQRKAYKPWVLESDLGKYGGDLRPGYIALPAGSAVRGAV